LNEVAPPRQLHRWVSLDLNRMRHRLAKLLFGAFLTCAFILNAASLLQAQGPPPPPPPAKDYFPHTWEEYPKTGPFRIRFPKEPQERTDAQGNFEIHYLECKGLLRYSLSYVDYQTPLEDPQKLKDILNGLKGLMLKSVQNVDHRLVTEREVNLDNHNGLFVQIEVQAKEVIRIEWFVVGSRLYTISTLSRKATEQEFKGKDDYEEIALAFINSFRLVSSSATKSNKSSDRVKTQAES
jgi:hypothetical protein